MAKLIAGIEEELEVQRVPRLEELRKVQPNSIAESSWQPRKATDSAAPEKLANSVRTHDALAPAMVRKLIAAGHGPGGRIELLAGERQLEPAKAPAVRCRNWRRSRS